VYNGGARLIVLLLADPHLLEGGQRSKDGTSNPDGILPFGRSYDLNLHCGWCEGSDLRLDRWVDPGVPIHLPADVDQQARVRRVWPSDRAPQVLLDGVRSVECWRGRVVAWSRRPSTSGGRRVRVDE